MDDRGSKKWSAMMLPEHIKMLKEVQREYYLEEKPALDEQQLEEINFKLTLAQKDHLLVDVKYYISGEFKHIKGHVDTIDYTNRYIRIDNNKLEPTNIIEVLITSGT
ncbi:YolD-like family protein [Virgibacillus sp. NKC19-3]|uniref:YolD-like family protein n=1 Tax=Virgibacillus saliphilus TaxID=2831674 RepID=UPI001C9A3742|nr:YolD-like family protein [Virgibacillus sp. NKC19-3]MBY7142609.1 YolD-like family protein [Virgibacillus sp. NKC19-3]